MAAKKTGEKREIKYAQNVKYTRGKGKSERRRARRRHQWKVVEGMGGEKTIFWLKVTRRGAGKWKIFISPSLRLCLVRANNRY